jgi:hypothetical protein
MKAVSEILKEKNLKKNFRNKYEFQAYGNRLSEELNDPKHRTLYIKLAKTMDRKILEEAREFALASEKIKEKGKIFMWRLQSLKEELKQENK